MRRSIRVKKYFSYNSLLNFFFFFFFFFFFKIVNFDIVPLYLISFQLATVFASENGLKVTVEDAKCVQANAFIQTGVFQEYNMSEDTATFKINLSILLVRALCNVINKIKQHDEILGCSFEIQVLLLQQC